MSAPDEAGNITFPEVDCVPLTKTENVLIYTGLTCFCVICFSVIVFGFEALFGLIT